MKESANRLDEIEERLTNAHPEEPVMSWDSQRDICYLLRVARAAEEAAAWLESRPDYTEGDAATASTLRNALNEESE